MDKELIESFSIGETKSIQDGTVHIKDPPTDPSTIKKGQYQFGKIPGITNDMVRPQGVHIRDNLNGPFLPTPPTDPMQTDGRAGRLVHPGPKDEFLAPLMQIKSQPGHIQRRPSSP